MEEKMEVALRVLNAVNDHLSPNPTDVEKLRRWLDPKEHNADPDELACVMIHSEVQRKQEARIRFEIVNGNRVSG